MSLEESLKTKVLSDCSTDTGTCFQRRIQAGYVRITLQLLDWPFFCLENMRSLSSSHIHKYQMCGVAYVGIT